MKTTILFSAIVGAAPAIIWALLSLVTGIIGMLYRPVTLSFTYHAKDGKGILRYEPLPPLVTFVIIIGAILIITGITLIPKK
jgi:hypothetical protein